MNIETATHNNVSGYGIPLATFLFFEFLFGPFHYVCYSYFFTAIIWKLHIVHYIVLEAFKHIGCFFMPI